MIHGFKPLLSETYDPTSKHIRWPMLSSPKLDGVRAIIIDGMVVSRSLKLIPNRHVQYLFGRPEYEGMDGELICGSPVDPNVYNITQSAVMSRDGTPNVMFHVFDDITDPGTTYWRRYATLAARVMRVDRNHPVLLVSQLELGSHDEALARYSDLLEQGYEGLMLRQCGAHYKFGRSTLKEGTLLKWKPLIDFDAEVTGSYEEMHNGNEATTDELGHTRRSSHAEGKVGKGTLGGLYARALDGGPEFKVGIFKGATKQDLQAWWHDRDNLVGKIFKAQKLGIGEKDLPRHPRWIGWRDSIDTSA